ncbi:MAG: hypothetical protein A2508_00470 [Candidatus Lambdaproteobacteria bacterium RIFOXYD12_FULL_49_8]|nr:MAG: hypothetical protein A2508_00470 [Candidatus Lambdaproteobacteria bacterium RIFOXYD12_FULL_49_8]
MAALGEAVSESAQFSTPSTEEKVEKLLGSIRSGPPSWRRVDNSSSPFSWASRVLTFWPQKTGGP